MTRRELFAASAAAGTISTLSGTLHTAGETSIRTFSINFPKSELDELRWRVAASRCPDKPNAAFAAPLAARPRRHQTAIAHPRTSHGYARPSLFNS